jgi:hypothetical protein
MLLCGKVADASEVSIFAFSERNTLCRHPTEKVLLTQVVDAHLVLVLQEHLAVRHLPAVLDILEVLGALHV